MPEVKMDKITLEFLVALWALKNETISPHDYAREYAEKLVNNQKFEVTNIVMFTPADDFQMYRRFKVELKALNHA